MPAMAVANSSATARNCAAFAAFTTFTLRPRFCISVTAVVSWRGTSTSSFFSMRAHAAFTSARSAAGILSHAVFVITSPPTNGAMPIPTMFGVCRYHCSVRPSSGVLG